VECEDCEEPIPEGRRKAAPGCTRCIRCQEHFERQR
jgi:phage/conjugal plasmid C-4 type zinc finger TraR family protein